MAELATAYVSLVVDTKKIGPAVKKELTGIDAQAGSSGESMGSKLAAGLGKTLKAGAVAGGAAAGGLLATAISKGFGRLNALDQAEAKLRGLGRSTEEIGSIMDSVGKSVKGTAFGLDEAANSAAMFSTMGVKSGEEMDRIMSLLADTTAQAGSSFDEMAPIFAKVVADGKLTTMTFDMLNERATGVAEALSQHLGVSIEEVSQLVKDGKIDMETFSEAMDGMIGGAAGELGNTFKGAFDNMGAALGRFGVALIEGPFKAAPGVFRNISDSIDDLTGKVSSVVDYLWTGEASGALSNAFNLPAGEMGELMSTLDNVRQKVDEFWRGIKGEETDGMFGMLGSSIRDIGSAVAEAMPAIGDIMMSLGEAGMGAAVVSLTGALAAIAPPLAGVLVPILETLAKLMSENQEVVNALVLGFVGMKAVNGATGGLIKFVGPLAKGAKGLREMSKYTKLSGLAFMGLQKGLGRTFPFLAKIPGLGAGATKAFVGLQKAVGRIPGLFMRLGKALGGTIVKAAGLASKAFIGLGKAMMANPIGLIIGLIAAVVAGLVWFFTQTEVGKELWSNFMNFLKGVWENISNWASEAWSKIVDIWNGIPEWFSEKWNSVVEGVSNAWTSIQEAIVNAWNAIVEWFVTAWEAYKAQVQANWEFVKNIFVTAWEAIKLAIQTAWTAITTWLSETWASFTAWVSSVWSGIVLIFSTVWNWIKTTIVTVWTSISTWITAVWTTFTGWVSAVWNAIVQIFVNVWNWIKTTIVNVWNSINSWISGAWGAFKSFVSSTWESVKSTISNAWEAIKATTQAVWDAIKAKIAESVQNMISKIQEFVSNIKSKFNEATSTIREFPGKVREVFSNAGRWLVQAGKNIINGLINGIKSMAGSIGNAITSILPAAVRGFVGFSDGGITAFEEGGITAQAFKRGGRRENHRAQIAKAGDMRVWAEPETGGEAYIPLAKRKRTRSKAILADVAGRFGLNLTEQNGAPVSSKTKGGTGPQGDTQKVKFFAEGGVAARSAGEIRRFVQGEMVDGAQAKRSLQGAPYDWGGVNWGDCSGAMSAIARFAVGLAPFAARFATSNQGPELSKLGFTLGNGPEGSLRMGWYNGGAGGGHTAGTLPDGTNVEMRGGNRGGIIGGDAWAWNHPRNTNHAFLRVPGGDGVDRSLADTADDFSAIPSMGGSGGAVSSAGDPGLVEVPAETAEKAEDAGMLSGIGDSWSEIGGNLAKTIVSGHIEDILGVFGIPNELPPLLKAGKTLYAQQQSKDDPENVGGIAAIDAEAERRLSGDKIVDSLIGLFRDGTYGEDLGVEKNHGFVSSVLGLRSMVQRGEFSDEFRSAFDLARDSKVVKGIISARRVAGDTWQSVRDKAGQAIVALFKDSDFTGRDALGIEEDHDFVASVLGLNSIARKKDFTPNFRDAFGLEEDHPIVDGLIKAVDAAGNNIDVLRAPKAKLSDIASLVSDSPEITGDDIDIEAVESGGVEEIAPVGIGSISMGEYKLGADFYASELAKAAAERQMGYKAAKIGYATMLVEVGDPPKMYASSVDTASKNYPHEAIGSDRDSSGLYQQRNNGAWGTIAQRMNPRGSASMFLNALAKVNNWQNMEEGAAAQAVQRSAHPGRYTQRLAKADQVMSQFKGKLPGFKNGGLVRGGKSRIKDDVMAMLQNGEVVINRGAVDADPEMALALNEGGPDAVRSMVMNDFTPQLMGGSAQEMVDNLLHGMAAQVGPVVSAGVSAGFGMAGAGAAGALGGLSSVVPGAGALAGVPMAAFGGVGDIASNYAGQVSSGIAHAFATAGSQLFSLGVSQVEEFVGAFTKDYSSMIPGASGVNEMAGLMRSGALDAVQDVRGGSNGSGDNYTFIAQGRDEMFSDYRKEKAKKAGRIGAR